MVTANRLALEVNGVTVTARECDRFTNATELCQAAGKKWSDYWRNVGTKDFIQALASDTGIPASSLVEVGNRTTRASWVHPQVVIHFAQWASPEFAVQVTDWVCRLINDGRVELTPEEAGEYGRLSEVLHDMHALLCSARQEAEQLRESNTNLANRIDALEERLALPPGSRSANVGPMWTVQDVLHESGWFTTSARQRANIRDRANRCIRMHTGVEVEQLNGYSVYTRAQVPYVDSSIRIERMRAQLAEAERGLGLFDGLSDAA